MAGIVSSKRSRSSPPSIREIQKTQIREAILRALGEKLAQGGLHQIAVADIAKKVGISARTIYRYYPSKDALIEALYKWSVDQITGDMKNERSINIENFLNRRQELFDHFDRHPNLVKAQLLSRVGREIRAIGSKKVQKSLDSAIAEFSVDMQPDEIKKVKAALYLLFSGEAWQHYRDVWGLNGKEAGEASRWVANLIVAELKRSRSTRAENK